MASKPKRERSRLWTAIKVLFILGLLVVGVAAGFAGTLIAAYSRDLPDVEQLRTYQPSGTTRIFAANGELIATLFKENRTWVPLAKISMPMRNAIIASEDARFYQHPGVDVVGMARVLWWVARSKGLSQGASTIDMQLARSIFLSNDVTARRKIQEMLVAIQLGRKFSKDQILELYLNQIYFGSGAYGIHAAAQTYFGKKASDLDMAEAAMIVGVVPAPSEYSPYVNPKLARERQDLVIRRMVETGLATEDQAKAALDEKLKLQPPRKDPFVLKYPYFSTFVLKKLIDKYGEDALYRAGLRIYTTMEPKLQADAQKAVADGVARAADMNVGQGALVAIEPSTGFVKAMVGGTGWSDASQFNRAWQSRRPAGSSFKIFVYSTAIENGFSPDSVVPDTPVTLEAGPGDYWSPKNSDGRFMGAIPLKTALQYSRNTVSAQLVERLTPPRVVDVAYKMGVKSHVDPILSIALGSCDVSPLDMASALATLANGGKYMEPVAVKLVEDADGKILEDNRHPQGTQAISPVTAFAVTEMMERAVNEGTGYAARLADRPAAGKTGTTDAHRDAWFCGFTPQLAAAVWVGNDDDSQMYGTFGGDVPAPIWKTFMEAALAGKPVVRLGADARGIVQVGMCRDTGLRANGACPDPKMEKMKWSEVPQRFCNKHFFSGDGRKVSQDTGTPAPSPAASSAPSPAPTEEASPGVEPSATPIDEVPSPEPPPIEASPSPTVDVGPSPEPAMTTEPPPPTPMETPRETASPEPAETNEPPMPTPR